MFEPPPDCTRVVPIRYDPNDTLATMIVSAWANPFYRDALLADARPIFTQAGFRYAEPKVLTEAQYRTGYVKTVDQVIFVLPDTPTGLGTALDHAKVAMQVTPFGM